MSFPGMSAAGMMGNLVVPGSIAFSTPGAFSFVVPPFNTLVLQVWGGGGGSGGLGNPAFGQTDGGPGGTSVVNGFILATGGAGSPGRGFPDGGVGGIGQFGTTNLQGAHGGNGVFGAGGTGGGAPFGSGDVGQGSNGSFPGGGAGGLADSGAPNAGGGGGGGFSSITLTPANIAPGATLTGAVAAGGTAGHGQPPFAGPPPTYNGFAGAGGYVVIIWS
jgi:hypothetical protein